MATKNDVKKTKRLCERRWQWRTSFGSDSDDSPSCDCYDWERQRLPCIHFFAIFRNYPSWSFEKLPKSYTESQFLTVDRVGFKPIIESSRNEENSQLNQEDPLQPNEALENENQATKNEKDVTPTLVDELKRKPSSHRTEAARCREKLGQIKNLTYVAEGWENANVLNQVKVKLDECYKLLTDASPKENGLVLEAPEKKTTACTSKANGKSHSTNPFKPIPQLLKKNPWSGRSGEKAATLKRCYVSSLMEIEGKKAKIGRTDSNMIQTDVKKEIIHTYSEPADEESDIELKKVVYGPTAKRGQFKMSDVDRNTIITRKELTDHIIGAAHNVLHKQFPDACGLQNTTLGPVNNFSIHRGTFFQILHTGTHHWVLVSNTGCKPASINLYDSLYNGKISSSTKKQIAGLLFESSPSITINIPRVQYQPNYVDCGVFAIAFLVSLLFNQDPASLTYSEGSMRSHLLRCLSEDKFSPFPLTKKKDSADKSQIQRKIKLSLMCNCRMPWNEKDLENPDLWCTQCEKCLEWFHKICSPTMPDSVLHKTNISWKCPKCS
ncbi:uncharacterized protein LOC114525772 [Dendronephthya gigantea]|uniref:uncharacterized protein LOC114525772 n=1 Tax=Dendronephthya gigantea TaxID=151771 RepID=UPI00106CED7B|nr:uncharacterized protein LOC114525772 [Dendronephthya gigantea]